MCTCGFQVGGMFLHKAIMLASLVTYLADCLGTLGFELRIRRSLSAIYRLLAVHGG